MMRNRLIAFLAAAALCFHALPALAQSSPNLTHGQVPTAAQWNSYFAAKQNVLGFLPVNKAGDSMSGLLITAAPTTLRAGFRLSPGVAPASPINGDFWATATGLYVRISGVTIGPLISNSTCAIFSASVPGCVPGSGGGAINLLHADGTWGAAITGNTFDNGVIGGVTPAPGTFTTLSATTLAIANLTSSGNPVIGGATLSQGTRSGNTTIFSTTNAGAKTNLHCANWDALGNVVDSGAPCGSGAGTSAVQDFLAGTDFTPGTTTTLTLSPAPVTSSGLAIFFDGIKQSANTWSLAGAVVTFNAAIPLSVQVVEAQWIATAAFAGVIDWNTRAGHVVPQSGDYSVGQITGAAPLASPTFTGVPAAPTAAFGTSTTQLATTAFVQNSRLAPLVNLLANTQWQIFSIPFMTKMNSAGNGTQAQISVSASTVGSNTTTFLTSNTQQLKVGDVVYFTGGDATITRAPITVTALTTNVSFTGNVSYNGVPVAGGPTTATPITVGDPTGGGSVSVFGPDGWEKYSSLIMWRDDFAANTKAGSPYSLGLRKTVTGQEQLYYVFPYNQTMQLRGRTVVFGAWVYQKVQGGANGWQLCIYDGTTNTCSAQASSGTGGYQWLEVSATLSATMAPRAGYVTVSSGGNSADIAYLSQPMLAFGTVLGTGNYIQNPGEVIDFLSHINPPSLTPFIGTFPAVAHPNTGGTLYGYNLDMEALSYTQIARTVRGVHHKLEFSTATAGNILFTGQTLGNVYGILLFGPQVVTQVNNVLNIGQGYMAMDDGYWIGPGYFSLFVATPSMVVPNITIDIYAARLN